MSGNVGDLKVKLGVEVDDSGAVDQLRAKIRALDSEPDPRINVNAAQADAQIARIQKMLIQVGGQDVEIEVDADANPALAELAKVQAEAKKLERFSPEVRVAAETLGAEQDLSRLDGILRSVSRAQYHATVNAETGDALKELQILRAELGQLDDRPAHVEVRADTDQAIRDLEALRAKMGAVGQGTIETTSHMAGFGASLAGLGSKIVALGAGFGIAQAGMGLLSRGLGFIKDSLFTANNQMDQTRATLMALTKSGSETEQILSMITKEAAKTPFVFDEMASAYTSLLPLSKQYNTSLQELVEASELLAASKPEQGLAGAAFALREAMSGDYVSLIERFDLPRQYINELKEQGVPALEIVRQAMGRMGYDAEIMTRRAETYQAQWSTFFDDLRMTIAEKGAPTFKFLNEQGLAAARDLTKELGSAIEDITTIAQGFGALAELSPIKVIVDLIPGDGDSRFMQILWYLVKGGPAATAFSWAADVIDDVSGNKDKREEAKRVEESMRAMSGASRDAHQDMRAEVALTSAAYHDLGTVITTETQDAAQYAQVLAIREAGAAQLRRQNMDTLDYITTLAAEEQMLYQASAATSSLQIANDRLSEAYQIGLQIQQTYTGQASEYQQQSGLISSALEYQKQRLDEGAISQDEYNQYVERANAAIGRYAGGMEDATLTAGEYAIQNAEIMGIQDQINSQFPHLVRGSEEYNQKLREAAQAAGISSEAVDGVLGSTGNLTGSIANELVPAIRDLIEALDRIQGTYEANVKVNVDASQLEAISGRFPGISLQAYAEGGVVDRPTVAMIGEDGPELVLPLTKPERMEALLAKAGMPMWADGGGVLPSSDSGSSSVPAASTIDWSFMFAGLDATAEDFAERAAQAFARMFGDIESLINGDALRSAREKLQDLFTLREIAIATGAGASVVAGLDAQIAAQQQQVAAIGAAMGSEVVAGMAAELASTETQQKINDALAKTLMDMTTASDPYQRVADLGQKIRDLREAIALAEAAGNSAVADQLRAQLNDVAGEFSTAQHTLKTMLEQGMLDDATIKAMAERGGDGFREIYDGVFGDGALAALEAGWSRLTDEQFAQLQGFVGKGKALTDSMVASIVDGLTSGALTIQQAMRLLGDEQGKMAKAQQEQLYTQLQQAEQQLMQALASGDQARIDAAQQNYDALMELIQAYAAATGRTVEDVIGSWSRVDTVLRNAVSGQIIKPPPSASSSMGRMPEVSSGGGSGFGSFGSGSQTMNLMLSDGRTIAAWYANDIARETSLAPVGIG